MISHDFPKDNEARKVVEISCVFYPFPRSEYTYSSLFWFCTGAVQKGNRGMLAWLLGLQIHVQGNPHEDSRLHS